MEMDNVQVTAVRQEIVNHSLLVKALIQVLVFLLRSFIILWGVHILGVRLLGYLIVGQRKLIEYSAGACFWHQLPVAVSIQF